MKKIELEQRRAWILEALEKNLKDAGQDERASWVREFREKDRIRKNSS